MQETDMTQLQLESQKYVQDIMLAEVARQRKERNRKAIHDFTTFLLGLVAMVVGVYAVQHQQVWLPVVQSFFR